jgi:hypothetical protein
MAQIVRQAGGLDDIGIDMPFKSDAGMTVQQFDRYRSSNLGHLEGMREPVVQRKVLGRRRDLGDTGQPLKLKAVKDPIAVAPSLRPDLARRLFDLGPVTPAVST